MKGISLIVFCLFTTVLFGQIPNANLSEGDENTIEGWKITSGKAGVLSSTSIKTSKGDSTVSASGATDKFAKITNSGSEIGSITSEFAWTERSAELKGRFIYNTNNPLQRFTIKVTYLDWIPALLKVDTMMEATFSVNPFGDEVIKNFDWFQVQLPIESRFFRLNGNPDSCIITITCENGDIVDENTVLLVDQLSFGTSVVASQFTPELSKISVYPNPSSGLINIEGVENNQLISIVSLEGRVVASLRSESGSIKGISINTGVYFVHISRGLETVVKKVVVSN